MNARKVLSASAAFVLGAAVAAPTAIWTWENTKPSEVKVQSSVPTPKQTHTESPAPQQTIQQPNVPTEQTSPDTTVEIVPERPKIRERVHVYHRPATTIFGYEIEPEKIIATFESGEKHIYTYRQVQHDNSRCAELATFERRSANPTLAPFYKGPLEHAPIKAFTGHRHGQKFHIPEGVQFTAPEHGFHHPEPAPAPVVVEQPKPVVIEQPTPTVIVQPKKPIVIEQPAPTVIVQQQKPIVIRQPAPVYVAPVRPNSYVVTPTHTHCTSHHHGHHHHSCRTSYTLRPSSYVVPMGTTSPYFSNLTYRVPTTTYVQPRVHYVRPQVTYVQPSVTYVRPRVRYVQPSITYVRPKVRYVQPTYHYVRPHRVHYSYRYVERHHPTTVRVVRHDYRPHRVIRHHGHDRHVRHYNYVHVR